MVSCGAMDGGSWPHNGGGHVHFAPIYFFGHWPKLAASLRLHPQAFAILAPIPFRLSMLLILPSIPVPVDAKNSRLRIRWPFFYFGF